MTAEDRTLIAELKSSVQATHKLLTETVVPDLAAVKSRLDHPSPRDCIMQETIERNRLDAEKKFDAQNALNTEIFKRLNALEIAWAKAAAIVAAVGVLLSFIGKPLVEAVARALHLNK